MESKWILWLDNVNMRMWADGFSLQLKKENEKVLR